MACKIHAMSEMFLLQHESCARCCPSVCWGQGFTPGLVVGNDNIIRKAIKTRLWWPVYHSPTSYPLQHRRSV